jgi:predicted GNAT family acetyltransferase
MAAIAVTREDGAETGRYVASVEGKAGQAVLRYRHAGPRLVEAVSTLAPEDLRGTGAAGALVQRLIEDARAEGFRIIPTCPYVRAQFDRHPDWAELRAG